MPADHLLDQAELYFRTHIHTVLPLHVALIEAMCKAPRLSLELATVLEDIGQGYCRLADEVNAELQKRDELRNEPDSEDTAEARIDEYVEAVSSGLGPIQFHDGQVVDGRHAIDAYTIAADALRTALVLARAALPKSKPGSPEEQSESAGGGGTEHLLLSADRRAVETGRSDMRAG